MTDLSDPKSKRRRWTSRIIVALIALALLSAIVSALMPKPVTVDTAKVKSGEVVVAIEEDGITRVKDRYVLSAPLAGNLARIELQEGARVAADEVVARILPLPTPLLDPRSQAQGKARLAGSQAALRQTQSAEARAQTALEQAEKEFARLRPLGESGNVAEQELSNLQFQVKARQEELASAEFAARVARHQVKVNEAALGRLSKSGAGEEELLLRSPIDGLVLDVYKQSEGAVLVGAPLLELGNPKALEVVVDVLTTDAVRIKEGAKAFVQRWGGAGELQAHVQRVQPKAFTKVSALGVEEQRVNVVLELDAPHETWASLGDGYRVEAKIIVSEHKNVLHVPAGAIFRHENAWSTYVIEQSTAVRRPLELGAQNGISAEVTKGLRDGDRVILHPGEKINEGVTVETRR